MHAKGKKSGRRPRRFFSEEPIIDVGQVVSLSSEESGHIRDILRLEAGASCFVTDGTGAVAEAVIAGFDRNRCALLKLQSIQRQSVSPRASARIHIYTAIPQKGYFDDWVRKAQELRIARLCPIETKRTVVKMKSDARRKVLGRWQRLAREAAKQSGSSTLVELLEPRSLEQAFRLAGSGEKVVFHPDRDAESFGDWLVRKKTQGDKAPELHLFFGPEGGFEDAEVAALRLQGAQMLSLGPTILKMDTAVSGVMGALRFLFP